MYIPNDKFARRAKKEGYRARSAYKLLDIQQKFRILKSGDFVLDLGAAPGSWMQVALSIIGKNGRILGIDKEPIAPFDNISATFTPSPRRRRGEGVKVLKKDIFDKNILECILVYFGKKIDVVLSDAAPATTGIKSKDQAESLELAERALEIASAVLKQDGNAVIKIFEGPGTAEFLKQARKHFQFAKTFKPVGSQKQSKETYFILRDLSR